MCLTGTQEVTPSWHRSAKEKKREREGGENKENQAHPTDPTWTTSQRTTLPGLSTFYETTCGRSAGLRMRRAGHSQQDGGGRPLARVEGQSRGPHQQASVGRREGTHFSSRTARPCLTKAHRSLGGQPRVHIHATAHGRLGQTQKIAHIQTTTNSQPQLESPVSTGGGHFDIAKGHVD